MLAIGELQRQAGPDQRVTATADIAGASGGISLAAGAAPVNNASINGIANGLSAVQPGTRYWTGVWKNSNLTVFGVTTPGTEIFTTTPSPIRLQWLVSGNEASSSITTCLLESQGSFVCQGVGVRCDFQRWM